MLSRRRALALAAVLPMLLLALVPYAASAQDDDGEGFDMHIMRRVNVHGDEYNSVAATRDAGRLVIGTEKGEVVVWNTARGRVERRLRHDGPVHAVISLGDGRRFLAVGGHHTGAAHSAFAREWDVETGASREWNVTGDDTLTLLACDASAGVVAAASGGMVLGRPGSRVFVWSARDGRALATWEFKDVAVGLAVVGETVYLTTADASRMSEDDESPPPNAILALDVRDPKRAPRPFVDKKEGRLWHRLAASPDGRRLAATRYEVGGYGPRVALLTTEGARETAEIEGGTPVWFAPDALVVFGEGAPASAVRLGADGAVARAEKFEGPKGWHTPGEPEDFKGAFVSADGKTAWGVFRQQAGLARWDLGSKDRRAELLSYTPSLVYAMDVLDARDGRGLAATGGDDRFVRVWGLKDFALLREWEVPLGVPQGVALVEGGRRVVYSYGHGAKRGSDARADNGLHMTTEPAGKSKDEGGADKDSSDEKSAEEKSSGKKTDGKSSGTKTVSVESRTEVASFDMETGARKVLLKLDRAEVGVHSAGDGFVYALGRVVRLASGTTGETLREFEADADVELLAVSNNRRWLAAADTSGALYVFEVATGRRVKSREKIEAPTCVAPTDDGGQIYTAEFRAEIRRWDASKNALAKVGSIRGQCSTLRLSADGRRFALGGNHHDVAVYDALSGERVGYYLSEAADFYVTNVWLSGQRLVYTADGGVLYDGQLVPSRTRR